MSDYTPQNNPNRRSSTNLGKIPPQVIELEEAVLGALMIEKESINQVIDVLRPESFYKTAHQEIYRAIHHLFSESEPIDLLTVTQTLRKMGKLNLAGGASYIMRLTTNVNSAANIEYHARLVTEQSIKRELISIATEIQKEAYDDASDVFDLLDNAEQKIFSISESNIRKNYSTMSPLVQQAIKEIEARKDLKDGLTGIPSGMASLDRLTAGWQKSDLVIIAARPGMGKTAFSLSVLRNAALEFGHPVAIFSLEMSELQLTNRLISSEAELESDKIKRGKLEAYEWQQLYNRTAKLRDAPIFIDDTPGLSILELRAKARRLKAQHDIQLIVIDYLQLMQGNSGKGNQGNREQEIANISRNMKTLAKELNVPILALSQLSRAVETRGGDKRPQLSDLRESGCITGDSLILDSQSGQLIPIKELADRNEQTPFTCAAVDTELKVKPHQLVKAFYSGKKPVFELKTRSGRRIKASANHPLLRLDGWTRLDKLQIGDKIAVPRRINITNPINPLDKEELILLAHLIGDACILPYQTYHYTSADQENLNVVRKMAKKLFDIDARLVPQDNYWHLYLQSPYQLTHKVKHPITKWYERLGIDRVRSYEKVLPNDIFQSDNEHIALFLHHLWATGGNISWKKLKDRKDSAAIYYASSSRKLCEQVQHLLLRLDILSSIKTQSSNKGHQDMYLVTINGASNQLCFLDKIGCFGERGRIIPDIIEALRKTETNPNYDVIPKEVWQSIIRPLKDTQEISWREFSAKLDAVYSGSALFKRGMFRKQMQAIYQLLPASLLNHLANSDVLWDEVMEINPLGVEDVYDATVNEVHNFVANDIILHNSIEQDADMVIFLYRPEYYGITEDMEGESTKEVGEVIIAKHRNGSLDTVKLRFTGRFTKFSDFNDPTGLGSANNEPKITTFPSKASGGFGGGNLTPLPKSDDKGKEGDNNSRLDNDPPF